MLVAAPGAATPQSQASGIASRMNGDLMKRLVDIDFCTYCNVHILLLETD